MDVPEIQISWLLHTDTWEYLETEVNLRLRPTMASPRDHTSAPECEGTKNINIKETDVELSTPMFAILPDGGQI